MINRIEGCRKVKKNEGREFLFIHCQEKIIFNTKQSGFGGVKFSVCRLERTDRREGLQMVI